MKIGLISDTHDNTPPVKLAARFFAEQGVDLVIHLGDVMDPETLTLLQGLPLQVVRGNNEDERAWPDSWTAELEGVRVFATHGHMRNQLHASFGKADVALHGHTHRRRKETVAGTLVVNPGALYRCFTKSVAILELPSKHVAFFEVREDGVVPMRHD